MYVKAVCILSWEKKKFCLESQWPLTQGTYAKILTWQNFAIFVYANAWSVLMYVCVWEENTHPGIEAKRNHQVCWLVCQPETS